MHVVSLASKCRKENEKICAAYGTRSRVPLHRDYELAILPIAPQEMAALCAGSATLFFRKNHVTLTKCHAPRGTHPPDVTRDIFYGRYATCTRRGSDLRCSGPESYLRVFRKYHCTTRLTLHRRVRLLFATIPVVGRHLVVHTPSL